METSLQSIDWVVIALYLVAMVAVGLYAARRVRKTADYFLGNRSFSVWLVIGQALGVGTHAEMPVSLAGKVYQSGYAGIWYQWKNLFITPFYWILAPLFRRFRRTTTGEVYEDRYGRWMGAVYTLFALAYFTFNMGAMLKGAGKLVSVASGEAVSANAVVLAMTATFLLYSFVGGLVSAAYTDFVQSIFIVALSFLLIPIGLRETGGFTGIRDTLEPGMLSMVTPGDVGVFTIVMLTLNGLIGIVAQPHILASVGTGRDERSCRIGMAYGNFIKRFCTIGWALVGIIVATLLVQRGEGAFADPEDAFGYATRELLFPGGLGLMIACVLAANMSTGSAFMVDSAALFTQNLYRRYVARDRSDRHYLWSGRFAGGGHDPARSRLRPVRRQCSAGIPVHRDDRRVHGNQHVRRDLVEEVEPVGCVRQPARVLGPVLLAHLPGARRAAAVGGRQFWNRPARRLPCSGRGQAWRHRRSLGSGPGGSTRGWAGPHAGTRRTARRWRTAPTETRSCSSTSSICGSPRDSRRSTAASAIDLNGLAVAALVVIALIALAKGILWLP